MSQSPKHTPFTVQVLDALDLNNRNVEKNIAKVAQEPPVSVQPPSFDSFPDLPIPSSSIPAGASGWNAPSFSSFPVDKPSTRTSSLRDPIGALEEGELDNQPKSKEKKKTKKEDRVHVRQLHEDISTDSNKRRSGDDRYDDSREKRKDKRRSRSRSRDRSSQSHRHEKDYRERDRHDTKDRNKSNISSSNGSRRRESSRDRQADRRSGYRDDRDYRRDDRRISSHSSRYGSGHTRDGSRSPDRKKSRRDEISKDESWSNRRDRDRDLEMKSSSSGKPPPSSPLSPSFSQRGSKADEKHKPGTWIIDVKGDRDALRFGGLDPRTMPRYNRAGGGRVLGLPGHLRIDFEKTRAIGNKAIVFRNGSGGNRGSRTTRYIDLHATWRDRSQEYKRISRAKAEELAKTMNLAKEDSSYISLDIRLGGKAKKAEGSDIEDIESDSEDEKVSEKKKIIDYRDIHGKSVYKEEDEDLLQTTSDQEEEGAESALDVLMRRRMMLDGELRKDPKQPEKWLEFIAVEDEIDLVSSRRSASAVMDHSTSHFEVKLSIFERALQSNPTNEHLLLEYMNTCRHCWEPAKVLSKWDELLQSSKIQAAWPGLWIEYLDFRQRHFLSFSVNSFARVLGDALDRLGRLARTTWLAIQKDKEDLDLQAQLVKVETAIVHVMARAWTFLKQAGYIERAQAIIQGQVEFLFNMPPSLATEPWDIQIGSLEEYWDSELPRFGEKDAKGWTHYVTEEDEVAVDNLLDHIKLPSLNAPTEELIKAFADKDVERYHYSRWATLEKTLNTQCWFPIRTTEEMPDQLEDDPYGIIIFDDIRPFIVSLYTPEARQQYVDCIFNFLGIPMNSFAGSNGPRSLTSSKIAKICNTYNPYLHDSLLMNVGIEVQSTLDTCSGLKRFFPEFESKENLVERMMKEIGREQEFLETEERDWNCVWNIPVRSFPQSTDVIFGKAENDSKSHWWATVSSHDEVQISNKVFIRNILQQLTEIVPLVKAHRRSLSLYHLMYEVLDTLSPSKGQKLAKKYLKADKMDLEMWNAYAQAEVSLGRISEARKVYSTTLSMYQSFPTENQTRAPLIYRFFAELEWNQHRPGVALAILLSFAEGTAMKIPDEDNKDLPMPTPTRLIKGRQFYSQKVAQLNLIRPSGNNAQSDSIGARWFEPALDLIVCYAWFEYLTSPAGAGPHSGVKVFENAIQELDFRNPDLEIEVPIHASKSTRRETRSQHQPLLFSSLSVSSDILLAETTMMKKKICTSVEAEMVWIQLAKLVYYHSLKAMSSSKHSMKTKLEVISHDTSEGGGFQPRDLRRVVQEGLERFPNCTILQSLFFWAEAKQRLHGRVRTWVTEQIMRSQGARRGGSTGFSGGSLASKAPMWIFGLFYELWNQEPYNPHMVRSILDSALESSKSSSFSSSPVLWLIYIELELRESARERGSSLSHFKGKSNKSSDTSLGVESNTRVKQLLLRALSDCPWCKDLYLIAFEPRMRGLFSLDELDQLYQTMLEKEIRLRHEIPEREPPRIAQHQEKNNRDDVS
ncbi:hypothetical protein BGX27_000059 [Mortierella sp. AM989]|nr:hypothetical protein BGX27_000059 [Mortierella sp. AM989]